MQNSTVEIRTDDGVADAYLTRPDDRDARMGVLFIMGAYGLRPRIEEMADRYGLLLWSEIPVYHVHNPQLGSPSIVAAAHGLLTQNILANQNQLAHLVVNQRSQRKIGRLLSTPAQDQNDLSRLVGEGFQRFQRCIDARRF